MLCGWIGFMCLIIFCLQKAIDSLGDDANDPEKSGKDGLAISREIFKNITKKLRANIKSEVTADVDQQKHRAKSNEQRNYAPYQGYHHHEQHWGPYFEESNVTQMGAHIGSEALLNCRVVMLKDKTVMWVRNKTDAAQLLTIGRDAHTGDNRLTVKYQYPNNWRISINPVRQSDEGLYMCQISTYPPRTIYTNLTILAPLLAINGDKMQVIKDRYFKTGSSIVLKCAITEDYLLSTTTKMPWIPTTIKTTSSVTTTTPTPEAATKPTTVFNSLDIILKKSWSIATTTSTSTVGITTTRMAIPSIQNTTIELISTQTTLEPNSNIYGLLWKKNGTIFNEHVKWQNTSATITISSASQEDSGLYTCQLNNHSQVTTNVHVLIGENQAAVHHDSWNKGSLFWQPYNRLELFVLLLLFTM